MSKPNLAEFPATNQYEISVEVRPGSGKAAFFADVRLWDSLTIPDWPIWKGENGDLQPALPTKLGKNGKRFPLLKDVRPDLLKAIFTAIRGACGAAQG